ncbi:MAG: phage holin [Ktedonobacteraceae bacterium]
MNILNVLTPELTSIIVCLAASTAAYLYQQAVQRLPANIRTHVQALANTTVAAIEQKYSDGSPGGALKKQEAMQMLLNVCNSLHIPLDATHASAAIEAAVYSMNMWTQTNARSSMANMAPTSANMSSSSQVPQMPFAAG